MTELREDVTVHQIGTPFNTIPPSGFGGTERVISNLSKGLTREGLDVSVYSPGADCIENVEHHRTIKTSVDMANQPGDQEAWKRHFQNINDRLEETLSAGDIVHFHSPAQVSKILTENLMEYDVDFIETCHLASQEPGLEDTVIFPSRAIKNKLGQGVSGRVIHHGIDTSRFCPGDTSISDEEFLFFAGRATTEKGIHIASEAAYKADKKLRVAGPGGVLREEKHFDHNLIEHVGELGMSELVDHYRAASGVLYLSQYEEPFGLGPVEALGCGTPVITTGKGGTSETVTPEKTGFFCESVSEVVDAINSLPHLDQQDCVDRAKDFSIKSMAREHIDYYRQLRS